MDPRSLLAKQRLVGGRSSSYGKRPSVSSSEKATTMMTHKRRHKMYTKSCINMKSIRHIQQDWRGTRQLPYLHSKSRYIRFHARIDQKSDLPLGSEDVANAEAGETSLCTDINSKGHGTLQGAMALIIGTSVGAGILALPARTMNAGFVPTLTTMGVTWCFLVLEALLLAEVNVALLEEHENGSAHGVLSLCAMAEKTLGPLGGTLSACIYTFLSYTVMVAYIAKSGDILSPLIHTSPLLSCWIFALVFGSLTLLGKTKLVDSFNQILTSAMIGTFLLIIMGGFQITDWKGLQHMNWGRTPETFPIIYFALVYHDLVPVLCTYLKGDLHRIRLSVLLGSAVSLAMFVCWDAVILCITPVSGDEDPLEFLIRLGGTSIAFMIESFSILALATSFMGTLIGFLEFFKERFNQNLKAERKQHDLVALYTKLAVTFITSKLSKVCRYKSGRYITKESILSRDIEFLYNSWMSKRMQIVSFVLILAPPLVALGMVSDAFVSATDLAGGYGMTTLYGLFPPIMAWSLYERGLLLKEDQAGSILALSRPQVQAVLVVSGTCATGIVVSQLMLDLGS
eukprot:c6872_g1_i1 orf=198-1904(+)